jgi:hypothetical protein
VTPPAPAKVPPLVFSQNLPSAQKERPVASEQASPRTTTASQPPASPTSHRQAINTIQPVAAQHFSSPLSSRTVGTLRAPLPSTEEACAAVTVTRASSGSSLSHCETGTYPPSARRTMDTAFAPLSDSHGSIMRASSASGPSVHKSPRVLVRPPPGETEQPKQIQAQLAEGALTWDPPTVVPQANGAVRRNGSLPSRVQPPSDMLQRTTRYVPQPASAPNAQQRLAQVSPLGATSSLVAGAPSRLHPGFAGGNCQWVVSRTTSSPRSLTATTAQVSHT